MGYLSVIRVLTVSAFLFLVIKVMEIAGSRHDITSALNMGQAATAQEPNQFEEKANQQGGDAPAAATEENKVTSVDEIRQLSEEEIQILQRLSERKKRLVKWEEDLKVKSDVLALTEEKIDSKLDSLRALKKEVEKSLAEYRDVEEGKTQSLVKIYESMKPKNAADIISKMKIEDSVPIMTRMKEKNAAEIFSKMDPKTAKEITTRLTQIGKLQNPE